MKLTIEIPDQRVEEFILYIKNLGYITWNEPNEIPITQQAETKHRLEMLENGTMKTRSWKSFEEEYMKKNGI
jgi:hypothetical protein